MKIYINQKEIEVQDSISVKELLDMQQIAIEGTAIAIDNKLVPQNEWNDRILTDGNKITIIRATFGGYERISRNEIYRHYRGTPHRTGKPLNHRPARQRIGFNPPPQTEVFRRKNRATVTLDSSPLLRSNSTSRPFRTGGKIPACRCSSQWKESALPTSVERLYPHPIPLLPFHRGTDGRTTI